MDREEAHHILQLCRPDNAEDRHDPLIAEALELLEQDADLRTLFEEEQALDAAISAEFSHVEPPADLKATILAGMRAHAAQSTNQTPEAAESIPFPVPTPDSAPAHSWIRPWMSVAAIVAVAGVVFMIQPKDAATTTLANNGQSGAAAGEAPIIATAGVPDMIDFLAQKISALTPAGFDKQSPEVGELQSHLASTGMPTPTHIPLQLQDLSTIGCVTFDYDGTKLSMICFKSGQVYHLITANKASVPDDCAPNCSQSEAKAFEHKQQAFKIWSEGDQIFILTTKGSKENLPDFI
jgi:hypothetical protein